MSKKKEKANPPFSTGLGTTKFPTDVITSGIRTGVGTGISTTKITTGVAVTKLPTYVSVKPTTVDWTKILIQPRLDIVANVNWSVLKFMYQYRESLPVLPQRPNVIIASGWTLGMKSGPATALNDTLDAKKKWYLPEYELKPIAEGGLTFTCEETGGTDTDGETAYRGNLQLVFRQKNSAPVVADATVVERIPLVFSNAQLSLKLGETMTSIPVALNIAPTTTEFKVDIPLSMGFVKAVFGTLSTAKACQIELFASYKAAVLSGINSNINVIDLASKARWQGGQLVDSDNTINDKVLPWQGSDGDSRGFVRADRVWTEDSVVNYALRTHPMWVGNGTIKGWLPWVVLPLKACFKAKIGFVKGAVGTDGAYFQVWEHHRENGREVWNRVGNFFKKYTDKLLDININLSHLAEKEVGIELRVDTGVSSGQDWAVWVNPTIEGDPYRTITSNARTFVQLDTLQPKATCTLFPEKYQFKNPQTNVLSAFGCFPPWKFSAAQPPPQYMAYNKISAIELSRYGISALYRSNFIDHQYLAIPEKYALIPKSDMSPQAQMTVANRIISRPEDSSVTFDFTVAPLLTPFQFEQLKKAVILSWTNNDDGIAEKITIDFPRRLKSPNCEVPNLAPNGRILLDDDFMSGYGSKFNVQLTGVELLKASILLERLQGPTSVNCLVDVAFDLGSGMHDRSIVDLSLNKMTGSLVVCQKDAATGRVILLNQAAFPLKLTHILGVETGKTPNSIVSFNPLPTVAALTSVQTETQIARESVVAHYELPTTTGFVIKERNFSDDYITQEITVAAVSASFEQDDVQSILIKLNVAGGNETRVELNSNTLFQIVRLNVPLSDFLGLRMVAYSVETTKKSGVKTVLNNQQVDLRRSSTLNIPRGVMERALFFA